MAKCKIFKTYPWYVWVAALAIFFFQVGIYNLAHWIATVSGMIDRAVYPVIPVIDDAIPFLKGFIFLYVFSYVYWVWGGILLWKTRHSHYANYVFSFVIAAIIGGFILTFYPTYIDREKVGLWASVNQPGFLNFIVRFIYNNDGGKIGFDLLPSFHCTFGTITAFWIFRQKQIKIGFRIASPITAILCISSTLFTKQHVFIDCVTGIGLGLIVSLIVWLINPAERIINKYLKTHIVKENAVN